MIATFTVCPCWAEFGFIKLMEAPGFTVKVTELLLENPSVVSDKVAVKTVGEATERAGGKRKATCARFPRTA